ncbi:SPL family radical SAM protein [Paenibacillus senegalensis]|uniref:SPL family radical SAM protein n=1 Tax=Paenibacillus senegalensis TaxID=1465766 RepID=UPI000289722B|nr:radical SAM protein [Paenibacillus senegalensis]
MNVQHKVSKKLLNPGSGFLNGYTHTLNPYAGCSFACSYCYVRRMPVALFRKDSWGTWVDVKTGAKEQLVKELRRAKTKGPVTLFMSSSTDPYQPVEYKEQVTRGLLEAMVEVPPDFVLVQTRSPLVTRDTDLFLRLGERVRVSMTVETDLDHIRRLFTPSAPPIQARLKALSELKTAGVRTQAAIAPVLPSSEDFPRLLKKAVDRVCIDDYFMGDGSKGRRTEQLGISQHYSINELDGWYDPQAYLLVKDRLLQWFDEEQIKISQEGFLP